MRQILIFLLFFVFYSMLSYADDTECQTKSTAYTERNLERFKEVVLIRKTRTVLWTKAGIFLVVVALAKILLGNVPRNLYNTIENIYYYHIPRELGDWRPNILLDGPNKKPEKKPMMPATTKAPIMMPIVNTPPPGETSNYYMLNGAMIAPPHRRQDIWTPKDGYYTNEQLPQYVYPYTPLRRQEPYDLKREYFQRTRRPLKQTTALKYYSDMLHKTPRSIKNPDNVVSNEIAGSVLPEETYSSWAEVPKWKFNHGYRERRAVFDQLILIGKDIGVQFDMHSCIKRTMCDFAIFIRMRVRSGLLMEDLMRILLTIPLEIGDDKYKANEKAESFEDCARIYKPRCPYGFFDFIFK